MKKNTAGCAEGRRVKLKERSQKTKGRVMAGVFGKSEANICIICLGENTKPIPPGCGHSICSSCLSKEPRPASCCPECQDFYQLDTRAYLTKNLEEEGNICIMCLGENTEPIPPGCGHSICSSCLSNKPRPASCCPECQDFYHLDIQANMAK
ncbi:tripartite motif-containing protein 65-like [Sarcophilus harrisii]|uniref:tripartite motif-containing protein 65-like n=1 Tax=Sarcophilus harrisii TaxID=9305 RepID=UPI0013020388|nr:tripartite motif-containing protein 65-like [Sarcophilus harrisii]